MNISVEYYSTPALWIAVDLDECDCDPDVPSPLTGEGKTKEEALNELVKLLIERAEENAYAEGQKDGQEQVRQEVLDRIDVAEWRQSVEAQPVAEGEQRND